MKIKMPKTIETTEQTQAGENRESHHDKEQIIAS